MENLTKYLFCYFTGNEPERERVHFAVSEDGFHFRALNCGKPVIIQTLGKKCCRDPYIFRDETGKFHIIATDMRSEDGWCNNNSIVIWDSDDLINWENERILDFSQYEETKDADRVWAPQVLFDEAKQQYMIYWTHHNKDSDLDTVIWHAYTEDFRKLTTAPKLLFAPKSKMCAIDADIIEKDGTFYLYEADGEKESICYCTAAAPDGPYYEPKDNKVTTGEIALEGNCMYKLLGTDKYIMIADKFRNGGYYMQITSDMINFEEVPQESFSLEHLKPRHGSMLHITDSEYEKLTNHYGISL